MALQIASMFSPCDVESPWLSITSSLTPSGMCSGSRKSTTVARQMWVPGAGRCSCRPPSAPARKRTRELLRVVSRCSLPSRSATDALTADASGSAEVMERRLDIRNPISAAELADHSNRVPIADREGCDGRQQELRLQQSDAFRLDEHE